MKEKVLKTFKSLGIDMTSHANERTLFQHSCAVAALLETWGESEETVNAAYFHSVYGREATSFKPIPLAQRDVVTSAIGPNAERICYLNCCMTALSFWRNFHDQQTLAKQNQKPFLWDRFQNQEVEVSWDELTAIFRLNFANMYDHIDPNKPLYKFKWFDLSLYLQFINFLSNHQKKVFVSTFEITEFRNEY